MRAIRLEERRRGPPLLQPFRDLRRLLAKEVVLAENASWLFRVSPYLIFAVTELLANPRARWVAALSLLLVFAWFCAMVLYLRASRARPG